MTDTKRKGARSLKDIPPAILEQLNKGQTETANLVEWLAVDQYQLLEHLLIQLKRPQYLPSIRDKLQQLKKHTVNTLNETIGTALVAQANLHGDYSLQEEISRHNADLVRCWATYMVGKNPALSLREKFTQIKRFAADTHFGVREISWLAMRSTIAAELAESLVLLSTWTSDTDANIRRFASEATRPRGVWCPHIESLKQDPQPGLIILESLRSDPSRYVQDSVGNWLNDAGKTQPDFVRELCFRWEKESPGKHTAYIIRKALRHIS